MRSDSTAPRTTEHDGSPTGEHPLPDGWERGLPCAVCGSGEAAVVSLLEDRALGCPGRFRLVRCRGCGVGILDPRPGPRAIAAFYPSSYPIYGAARRTRVFDLKVGILKRAAGSDAAGGGVLDAVARALARSVMRLGRDYFAGYPVTRRTGSLLDVGCGTGFFLELARATGHWRTLGIEPDAATARSLRDGGLDVIEGRLDSADLGTRRFDVVRLWHVFEHLHDPRGDLARLRTLLVPGGELVLGVPAFDSLAARWFGSYWAGWEPPRHLYHYTSGAIRQLLESSGFRVQAIHPADCRTLYGSLQWWWNARRSPREGPPRRGGRLFNNRALVLAGQPLALLGTWLGIGDALTVHAVRTADGGDA